MTVWIQDGAKKVCKCRRAKKKNGAKITLCHLLHQWPLVLESLSSWMWWWHRFSPSVSYHHARDQLKQDDKSYSNCYKSCLQNKEDQLKSKIKSWWLPVTSYRVYYEDIKMWTIYISLIWIFTHYPINYECAFISGNPKYCLPHFGIIILVDILILDYQSD